MMIWKEFYFEVIFDFKFGDLINCIFMFDKVFCFFWVGFFVEECFYEIVVFDMVMEKYNCVMLVGFFDKYWKFVFLKFFVVNGKLYFIGWIEDKRLFVFEVDLLNKNIIKVV